ncbi:DUF6314 family protein [Jannaschia sp. M317]|uniref:DUF6314 family protein n=1 Tax=Jannaschia sp. M317 TaxID=2867011 RepID=UPI0021A3DAFC|nr:DUF6314 family protein [Jannaschia sp. M317]UWQ17162.1 trigger factor [Jannaschia sp. M317]
MKLADLAGDWRVLRAIRHADGTRVRFEGRAVWTAEGDRWRSLETGRLRQGDVTFEARRETIWQAQAAGIDVRFGDGRFFHHIAAGSQVRAHHDCPPDDYRLMYDFRLWPHWSVRWRVTGPRKDYRALTRYVRP